MQTSLSQRCQFLLFKLLFLFVVEEKTPCLSFLELHQDYCLVLQRYAGQHAVLQALPLGRSYEIKRLLDNRNICRQFFIVTLSIMSTNSFSPTIYLSIYLLSACIFQRFQQKSGESCSVIVAGNELFLIRHEHFIKKSFCGCYIKWSKRAF